MKLCVTLPWAGHCHWPDKLTGWETQLGLVVLCPRLLQHMVHSLGVTDGAI